MINRMAYQNPQFVIKRNAELEREVADLTERLAQKERAAACAKMIRARLAEEIEARKKADAENRKLVDLLAPFVKLGAGEQLTPPYHDLSDDVVIYSNSGANITVGDVRSAYRAVAVYQTMSRGI